jgi:hypothetical protein
MPAPTITSLSPSTVSAGGPSFLLTVNGTGFIAGTTVSFGADSGIVPVILSTTQLLAPVKAADIATPATVTVTVTNTNGSVTASFTVPAIAYPYKLSDLRNQTLTLLSENSDSAAPAFFSGVSTTPVISATDQLNLLLNQAQEDIARTCYPLADTATVSPSIGQASVPFSSMAIASGGVLWTARTVTWGGALLKHVDRSAVEIAPPPGNAPTLWSEQGSDGVMLWAVPGSVQSLVTTGLKIPARMVNDTDSPTWLEPDLAIMLPWYAAFMVAEKNLQNAALQARAGQWRGEYQQVKNELLTRVWNMDPLLAQAHFGLPVAAAQG